MFVFFYYNVTSHSKIVPKFRPGLQITLAPCSSALHEVAEASAGLVRVLGQGKEQKRLLEVVVSSRCGFSQAIKEAAAPTSCSGPGAMMRMLEATELPVESVWALETHPLNSPRNV